MSWRWVSGALAAVVLSLSPIALAGGEVPWPISIQNPVATETSTGLWELSSERGWFYYNVEMLDEYLGFQWMRITEIDHDTLKIIRHGEGFYCNNQLEAQEVADEEKEAEQLVARYLFMFPERDVAEHSYLLRVVELDLTYAYALGLSFYPHLKGAEPVHAVGYRIKAKPLNCGYAEDGYRCDFTPITGEKPKKKKDDK